MSQPAKPSKQYTKLLKNSKKSESINLIKNDNGQSFSCDKERSKYLEQKFAQKFAGLHRPTKSIEEFFGDKINHPLVQRQKLSEFDRN